MQINIKKLKEGVTLPKYGTTGAACFDLSSSKDVEWSPKWDYNRFICYEAVIPTGLVFEVPEGYRMDIYPRSGWGFKHNIQLANGTGKIDSDYRGEVMVKLIAFCSERHLPEIKTGTRVAQAEINPVIQVSFKEAQELSDTNRGSGGFGSTGH